MLIEILFCAAAVSAFVIYVYAEEISDSGRRVGQIIKPPYERPQICVKCRNCRKYVQIEVFEIRRSLEQEVLKGKPMCIPCMMCTVDIFDQLKALPVVNGMYVDTMMANEK